jgi:hypothetical protein
VDPCRVHAFGGECVENPVSGGVAAEARDPRDAQAEACEADARVALGAGVIDQSSIGLAQRFAGRRRQRHHRFPKGNEVVLHIFGSPFLIDVFTVRAALTASSPYDISFH